MEAAVSSFKNINLNSFKGYGRVSQEQERLEQRRRTRKRISIIVVSSIVLVLIVVGAVAASGGFRRSDKSPDSPSPPRNPTSRADTIKAMCNVTRYPDSCIASLSAVTDNGSSSMDPQKLFRLSLQVALRELSNVSGLPEKLAATVKDDKRVKQALSDCGDMINDAMDELNNTISGSQDERIKVDDLKTWLSSVLTNMESCLDGLDGTAGGFRERLESALGNSTIFTSNSLAMVNKIFSFLQGVKTPFNRRLLSTAGSHGFPSWVSSKDRKLLQDVPGTGIKPDVVVGPGGTVPSLKAAIDMVPLKSNKRFVIFVKTGKYVENVLIDKKRQNVMLVGEGMDKTIISGNFNVKDGMRTFSSATFAVTGSGFIAKDIGFENTAGAVKEQAVAVRSGSDRSVFYRCRFDGHQDTLYAHSNRQFYKDCTISGTVDFIFGNAAVVFQGCTIFARQPLNNQKNTITAQGRTDPGQNTGISIHASQILPEGNGVTALTYLGRPWKPYCLTVIMKSKIDGFVHAAGWMSWDGSSNSPPGTIFYAEYQNAGAGSGTANRVKWKGYYPAISDSIALRYTVQSFIGGDDWIPSTGATYSSGL